MARIKLIDDDVEFAENTATILRAAGHEVSLLHSDELALAELVRDRPDLAILDVMFPDNPVAGFDLARKIRRTREIRDLPILLITAVNQEFPMDFSASDIDPQWMPVQDFVEKPVAASRLLKAVDRLVKGRKAGEDGGGHGAR